MDFGKITSRGYDKDGNLIEINENVRESEVVSPLSKTIEIRIKVHNQTDEFTEYTKFSDEVHTDPGIMNPTFRIATSRCGDKEGYYYVIKSYTKLVRF